MNDDEHEGASEGGDGSVTRDDAATHNGPAAAFAELTSGDTDVGAREATAPDHHHELGDVHSARPGEPLAQNTRGLPDTHSGAMPEALSSGGETSDDGASDDGNDDDADAAPAVVVNNDLIFGVGDGEGPGGGAAAAVAAGDDAGDDGDDGNGDDDDSDDDSDDDGDDFADAEDDDAHAIGLLEFLGMECVYSCPGRLCCKRLTGLLFLRVCSPFICRGPWWRVIVHMSDGIGVCMIFVFGFIVFPKTITRIQVAVLTMRSPQEVHRRVSLHAWLHSLIVVWCSTDTSFRNFL